ncbi:MAG: lipopolysaccharide biosynthesis protein [Candidatus Ornithospirochaeta sp.]
MAISIIGTLFVSNRVLFLIGDYNYGLWSFVCSITSWLTVVSSALTSSYLRFATKEAVDNKGDTSKTNGVFFSMLLILGSVIFVMGTIIVLLLQLNKVSFASYSWKDSQLLYILFFISIINISVSMPTCIYSLILNYNRKFVFIKLTSVFVSVATFVVNYLIARFTGSIIVLSINTVVSTLALFIIEYVYVRKTMKCKLHFVNLKKNKVIVSSIIAFSSILLLNSIVDQINTSVDKTLLGIMSVPENVTIYQFGQQFCTYLLTMSLAVSGVFSPSFHKLVAEEKRDEVNGLYMKVSGVQTIILCLVAFGFLSCGKDFVIMWLGKEREEVYKVAVVLMMIDLCPLTMNSSIEIQRAADKHKFRAFVYFLVAIVNLVLSIIFVKMFPAEYAIEACLLGSVIARILSHWLLMNIYNSRVMKLPVKAYMLFLFKYMVVGSVSFLITELLKRYVLIYIPSIFVNFLIEGVTFSLLFLSAVVVLDGKRLKTIMKERAV